MSNLYVTSHHSKAATEGLSHKGWHWNIANAYYGSICKRVKSFLLKHWGIENTYGSSPHLSHPCSLYHHHRTSVQLCSCHHCSGTLCLNTFSYLQERERNRSNERSCAPPFQEPDSAHLSHLSALEDAIIPHHIPKHKYAQLEFSTDVNSIGWVNQWH